jgi:Ca2+/Na+ antiporter
MKSDKKTAIEQDSQKKAFSAIILFFLTLGLFLLMLYANIPNIYRVILFIPFYRILLLMIESYYQISTELKLNLINQKKEQDVTKKEVLLRVNKIALTIALVITIAVLLF